MTSSYSALAFAPSAPLKMTPLQKELPETALTTSAKCTKNVASNVPMVHPETLRRRLEKLDEFIEYLEHAQTYSFDASNVEIYSAVERNLHLSVEALNDMAGHLVVDGNLGSFEQARDLPALPEEHGLIDEEDRDAWQDMIGVQNVLVHAYADIDRRTVYNALQEDLDDIRRLSPVSDRFLK